ncbi:flavin reductase family protein [Novosphingobium taihuense]|uniref:Flavin reductase (DIM6/NTAB) family NADH-FMN oxidoreductase RutF n=1 Tax=Novosphingobium taihuense TaxID=260085 RepID=A0A7W7AAM6_9SPHN|nr:flavin reductase family protein [Novosphingobium taihuense]MBB4613356.1 flavin reductase (DIM6/NTAB) family NADH-FMN oxidoreductase RutF [Novosphingobium taihuense]
MAELKASERYRILGSCIVPRPIAWVSSLSRDGVQNLAPFSFFNAMGNSPPVLAIGMVESAFSGLKDTPANIRDTGEFVVNLVSEDLAETMNLTSADHPPEIDEAAIANVALAPSVKVKPPRVASAPVAFECRTTNFIETGPNQVLVVGEVLVSHVDDRFVLDSDTIRLDIEAMRLVARLHGRGWYSRQTDLFEMLRPRS